MPSDCGFAIVCFLASLLFNVVGIIFIVIGILKGL